MASPFVSPSTPRSQTFKVNLRALVPTRNETVKKRRGPDGQRIWTRARRTSARVSLIQTFELDASEEIFTTKSRLLEPELEQRFSQAQGTSACRLSHYNGLYPYPSTPKTPKQTFLPPPLTLDLQSKTSKQAFFQQPHILELPGSLLLPSQGFPQTNPPSKPPRLPHFYQIHSTGSSDSIASTPELSQSPGSDFSESEMPKNFPQKLLPRATKSVKSTATSTTQSSNETSVWKPLPTMNAEELLRCLPDCNSETVRKAWIPAMIKEHAKIKSLLQDASEIKMEEHSELKYHGEDIKSISEEARRISNNYNKAMRSMESLVERDIKSCLERLEATENTLETALATIEINQRTIDQKEDAVIQLRCSLDNVVQVLGAYIHENISDAFYNADFEEHQAVMQIIADHEYSRPHDTAGRFLRVSEDIHTANVAALREAQLKIEKYREVAVSQNAVICRHSADLDSRLVEYEECVKTINERNDKISLLDQKNERLQETVEEFESGFRVSSTTKAVQDQLFQENEEIQQLLANMKAENAKQLEDRDAEIRSLRQKLGNANEEVLARKEDVKNVITHTQALLSPQEPSEEMYLSGFTPKERKMLIKEQKERSKKGNLLASRSMLNIATHPEVSRLKNKEMSRFSDSSSSSMDSPPLRPLSKDDKSQWSCSISHKRSSPDFGNTSDIFPNYPARPRSESPRYRTGRQFHTTGDRNVATAVVSQLLCKDLPAPLEPRYAMDIYGGDNNADDGNTSNNQLPGVPKHDSVAPVTQRKRVLSEIPEASAEDTESDRTVSPDSAAQDDFKHGVHRIFEYLRDDSPPTTVDSATTQCVCTDEDIFKAGVAKVVGKPILRGGSGVDDKKAVIQDVSPLSKVAGIRIGGDPWLSCSPRRA